MTKRLIRLGAFALALSTPAVASETADELPIAAPVAATAAVTATAGTPAAPAEAEAAQPRAWAEADTEAQADTAELIGTGTASFYAAKFHGRRTASGQRFDMHALTAAHRTLPFGSKLRVTNTRNGKSVVVTINDRGPFHGSRVLDVSPAAAERLSMVRAGSAKVRLELLG